MSDPIIGFMGFAIMGKFVARNLVKPGYPLVVLSRSRVSPSQRAHGLMIGTGL